eukprot:gnl/TRDRNA2_/TRDRNA2_81220_c0_seq2.p1 gnl/TRDRNA2_/TRDRNA2_81220_c0~~gnl/TRDRNA2_/TRDRNA2_81220_c0_seq2.p1  ORF type:complete len:846 (+),score=260.62 gnl/TRDRNA2_/TRDRNA2_81220_c0_seq2:37-2538(+)
MAPKASKKKPVDEEEAAQGAGLKSSDAKAQSYTSKALDKQMTPKQKEASILFSAAENQFEEEEMDDGFASATDALKMFREEKDKEGVADTVRLMVSFYLAEHNHTEAEDMAATEYAAFKDSGDKMGMAKMLLSRAQIKTSTASKSGEQEALDFTTEAVDMFKSQGDKKWEAEALLCLADVHNMKKEGQTVTREGRAQKALEAANSALEIFESIGDKKGEGEALHKIALSCFLGRGNWRPVAEDALDVFQAIENKPLEAQTLETIARFHLIRQNPNDAFEPAKAALAIWRDLGSGKCRESKAASYLMQAHLQLDEVQQAVEVGTEALRIFEDASEKRGQALIHEQLVDAYVAMGQLSEAMAAAESALRIFRDDISDSKCESKILTVISRLQLMGKEHDLAVQSAEKAIGMYTDLGDAEDIATALDQLANVHISAGNYEEALDSAKEMKGKFAADGNKVAEAMATVVMCNAHAFKQEFDEVIELGKQAQNMFRDEEFAHGEAKALGILSEAYMHTEQFNAAYNAATRSRRLYKASDDATGEARMLIASAQASISILGQQKAQRAGHMTWKEVSKMVDEGLRLAKKLKDSALQGNGFCLLSQVHASKGDFEQAITAADDAVQSYRDAGDVSGEIQALLFIVQAQQDLKNYNEMYEPGEDALDLARYIKDEKMIKIAEDLLMVADSFTGRDRRIFVPAMTGAPAADMGGAPRGPTQIELNQMRMAQMGGGGGDAGGAESQVARTREKGESISLANADEDTIRRKIQDVAVGILGLDTPDELEGDMPFMNAGLTSASSVLFRDELASEMQGVNLPFTLVFDYPSVNAVTDLIMEKVGN